MISRQLIFWKQYNLFLRTLVENLLYKKHARPNTGVVIHQIYYHPRQRKFLSRKFIPYFNPPNEMTKVLHENAVFFKEYFSNAIVDEGYFGYLSWKFEQKTYISARQFISFINENPGYDVYFINPFPELGILFKNVWEQGDYHHPKISKLVQSLLLKSGYEYDIHSMTNDETTLLYANYWVGNKKFWDSYIPFLKSVYDQFLMMPHREQKSFLRKSGYYTGAGYLTFIFERLFSTYLYFNTDNIKAKPFIYSPTQTASMIRQLRKIAGQ
jgi:hypothetical protein